MRSVLVGVASLSAWAVRMSLTRSLASPTRATASRYSLPARRCVRPHPLLSTQQKTTPERSQFKWHLLDGCAAWLCYAYLPKLGGGVVCLTDQVGGHRE